MGDLKRLQSDGNGSDGELPPIVRGRPQVGIEDMHMRPFERSACCPIHHDTRDMTFLGMERRAKGCQSEKEQGNPNGIRHEEGAMEYVPYLDQF
jgi:hypothetical protein